MKQPKATLPTPAKPAVHRQGKAVVEWAHPSGQAVLVMFPNGDVRRFICSKRAEKAIKRWFGHHVTDGAIGVGEIEWRDGTHTERMP